MDIITVLKDIKERYSSSFDEETIKNIDKCINNPEIRLETKNGELIAYAFNLDNNIAQMGICLESSDDCIDLCMVETANKNKSYDDQTTGENYEMKPGDVKILVWSDTASEDYTQRFMINEEEIKEVFNIECDEDIEKE